MRSFELRADQLNIVSHTINNTPVYAAPETTVEVLEEDELIGGLLNSTAEESDVCSNLYEASAEHFAVSEEAMVAEQLRRQLARASLLARLTQALSRSLDLSEMLHTATHELGSALDASRVHIRPYNPPHTEAHVTYAYTASGVRSLDDFRVFYDDSLGQHLLRDQQIVVIPDTNLYDGSSLEINALIREQASQTGVRSQIVCPLVVQGSFRGALCIHQTDRVRCWTADEIMLVETVAAQLSTGIAQAELFEMVTRAKKEWEATFDAMSDGIFIFDNEKRLVRINRTGAALEDSYPHLLLGRRCCELLRSYRVDSECIVERAIAEARSITLEVTPDRLQRPLLVTVEPILEQGRTSGAVCTVRDLSELREVQTEARESQSLLMNILESAREAIFALDLKGRVQWCNTGTAMLSRMPSDKLIGSNPIERISEEDRAKVRRAFRRALAGESLACEVGGYTGDGELRYALIDYAPLFIEGRTTGVLGIARDITEQKQEREHAAQADKLRALGQLASGVAHDLNNSLAAILGRTQLLNRATEDVAHRQHLDIINTAAEDAAATVRRVQTFARQSQANEFELLDLHSLLQDAIEITRTRWENEAQAQGCPCHVELIAASGEGKSSSLNALGVASELREVFVNLIVNAIDAMSAGGRLTIKGEQAGERLRLYFTDTGAGMSSEVRTRIFEPFYTTKGVNGTGLGLFVSFGIIERHHGTITAHSETGRGTTFTVELPAAAASPFPNPIVRADESPTKALSMLVVDDELFVRTTLGEMLSALGHDVTTAESGKEACEQLARKRFHIVLTDLSMPEMDGWGVARAVRQLQPEARTVLVTGYGTTVTPPDGEEGIISGILSKPFDFTRVAEMIK